MRVRKFRKSKTWGIVQNHLVRGKEILLELMLGILKTWLPSYCLEMGKNAVFNELSTISLNKVVVKL